MATINQEKNLIKKADRLLYGAKKLKQNFRQKTGGMAKYLDKEIKRLEKETAAADKELRKQEKETASKMDKLVLKFIADLYKE